MNTKIRLAVYLWSAALCGLASCSRTTVNDVKVKEETQPLIKTGDLFLGADWNDPHVLYDGVQFIMYASASQNFDHNVKTFGSFHWVKDLLMVGQLERGNGNI
ncbi:MAG: hypothetical protein PHP42_06775 [Bacteroidota bacterium]|nr:hypothetical protein [Bacteroidota bacterium]